MIEKILLSLVSAIALVITIKRREKTALLNTLGLCFGILLSWTGIPILISSGMILHLLIGLSILLQTIRIEGSDTINRTMILFAGLFTFLSNTFALMNWPNGVEIRVLMLIPISFFIVSLFYGITKRREFGYMTILNVEFISRLIF